MKRFVEGEDRLQGILLPEFLDDYVAEDNLGREPINLPVGWRARVRYAPMATEFRSTAK